MQFNGLNSIQIYIIFVYMQFNVHNLILIYTIFICNLMLLILCLLFFIPFNVYNYIHRVCLYMYYSVFMVAKHNKTIVILM